VASPYRHGNGPPLPLGGRPKLTPEQDAQIKRERDAGATVKSLAAKYRINEQSVTAAVRRADAGPLSAFALPKDGDA
jgi:Mor family transcriptional regulator